MKCLLNVIIVQSNKRRLPHFLQASEGRDYLFSLEHIAVWVADRVLPFLNEGSNDEDENSAASLLLPVQIIEVRLFFITAVGNLLRSLLFNQQKVELLEHPLDPLY